MKPIVIKIFPFAAAAVLVVACDQPRLFEAKPSATNNNSRLRGSNGDPVITMGVTGGIAGVNRQLVIDSNGFVSLVDRYPDGPSFTDYLTAAEYAELQAKFLAADFFHLDDQYTEADVADAFYYDITYRSNGVSHRVVTDYFAAPTSLREIVDALNAVTENLTTNRLQLTLSTSADTLQHGQTVKLALTAKNLSDVLLTLQFRDGQIYDFYAEQFLPGTSPASRAFTKVWDWSHDKAFTQALRAITLLPGETLSYEIDWDGRDNSGQLLTGLFYVRADLVSVPGGSTRLVPLHINE